MFPIFVLQKLLWHQSILFDRSRHNAKIPGTTKKLKNGFIALKLWCWLLQHTHTPPPPTHPHTHTCKHTRKHTYTHTHTHTHHTHTHTHTHKHTHTHTHTHTSVVGGGGGGGKKTKKQTKTNKPNKKQTKLNKMRTLLRTSILTFHHFVRLCAILCDGSSHTALKSIPCRSQPFPTIYCVCGCMEHSKCSAQGLPETYNIHTYHIEHVRTHMWSWVEFVSVLYTSTYTHAHLHAPT